MEANSRNDSQKGRKGLKVVLIIIAVVVGFLIFMIVGFVTISTGKIENYRDENGNVIENSIAEKIIVEINGADNGLIIRGKDLDNPILLLVSSGPGPSDYLYNEAYPNMNLEDYYTVCYWDYRGMCLVYDPDMDPQTITTEQILADAKGVTDYLKERFGKEKIYIMGFSGGTHIALESISLHPEDYYAYFAMAQVVCSGPDNDTPMYEFMKKTFTERGDKRNLKKLDESVIFLDNGMVICKDWASYVYLLHKAGGGTIKDKTEFTGIIIPILKAHCYTAKEKIDYIRGMKMYRTTPFYKDMQERDYRNYLTKVDVPVYFISGEYDYNCPWVLVQEYYEKLNAPDKDFLLVENAAHSPLWENPEAVVEYLATIRTGV